MLGSVYRTGSDRGFRPGRSRESPRILPDWPWRAGPGRTRRRCSAAPSARLRHGLAAWLLRLERLPVRVGARNLGPSAVRGRGLDGTTVGTWTAWRILGPRLLAPISVQRTELVGG